ncbi:hypothetical protein SAMN04487980_101894 [Streptomyces sp. cf124]|nr:hypothetical protein SAMN04487980_101894 [Streptomyces sp. cf124]
MGSEVVDLDSTALAADDPYERVGYDLGADLVRDAQPDGVPGEGVAVAVRERGGTLTWLAGLTEVSGLAGLADLARSGAVVSLDLVDQGGDGGPVEVNVEEAGTGDLDGGDAVGTAEVGSQDLGNLQWGPAGGPGELQGDVRGVVPTSAGPGRSDDGACGDRHAQLTLVHSTTHRAQHGAGELDGGHGTSVWEEGGGYASRFTPGSAMWTAGLD